LFYFLENLTEFNRKSIMFHDLSGVRNHVAQGFSAARVLVIGDMMLDCHVRGEVSRISPEAPVLVVRRT
jgi:D-beta-D-heptose 7-phosphate kinase / D-beta-D-heptose 1-phosphate adenosyltransferase